MRHLPHTRFLCFVIYQCLNRFPGFDRQSIFGRIACPVRHRLTASGWARLCRDIPTDAPTPSLPRCRLNADMYRIMIARIPLDPRTLFGQRLAQLRKARGWSQETLALESGVARSYLGGVERGQRNISLVNICRLAATLELPPSNLLEFEPVRKRR